MAAILIFNCTEGAGVGDYSSHASWQPVTQTERKALDLDDLMGK